MWNKLTAKFGQPVNLETLLDASDVEMREAGMSRQKAGYLRSLAGLVLTGELDLAHLPEDDEEAIAQLIKIKGIGRWSAEIYLLFAEGRHDVWPAGDLAVQIQIGKLLGLEGKPTEKQLRELGEKWRPHRGAAAVLAWHSYNSVGHGALARQTHAVRSSAETSENPRPKIKPEWRQLFVFVIAAADEVAGRSLAFAAAPAEQDVERHQRHEQPASVDFEAVQLIEG
jgi:hypothetical protein